MGENWADLYRQVQNSATIPETEYTLLDQDRSVFRGMCIRLADVGARLQQQHLHPTEVHVYADVIQIPDQYDWVARSSALILAARRIETAGTATLTLDYREDDSAVLALYAQELAGNLSALAVTSAEPTVEPTVFDLTTLPALGAAISLVNGKAVLEAEASIYPTMVEPGSQFHRSLVTIYQYGTILFESQPRLAAAMFEWIRVCAAQTPAVQDLCLPAAALLTALQAAVAGGEYVPLLNRQVYAEQAQAFVKAAEAFEQQYDRFTDANLAIADRKDAATLMLSHYRDTSQFVGQLIQQTQSNLTNAQQALDTAQRNLELQQLQVKLARVDFEAGIRKYQEEKELEAALQIVGAILEFAAAIPLMFAGDEAAASGVALAVAKTAQQARQLAETMKAIARIIEAVQKAYKFSTEIAKSAKDVEHAKDLAAQMAAMTFQMPSGDDPTGTAEWELLRTEVDTYLQPALQAGIDGAAEYKVQLDALAIYGQSLAACQANAVKLTQELVRLMLQKQVSDNQQARLQQYVSGLTSAEQITAELVQAFFQRYLEVKRALFVSFENYHLAYKYWALRESRFEPSMAGRVADLYTALANIQKDFEDALASFRSQQFQGKVCTVSDPQVLASLRQNRTAGFAVALADPAFRGFSRVRANTIRVWLDGARPAGGNPIYAVIGNSGAYRDRLQTNTFQFTAHPLQLIFQYAPGGQVFVDGRVAEEEQFAYFEPTPFTEWTVSVPAPENEGLDLTGLTAVRLEFAGSVTGM